MILRNKNIIFGMEMDIIIYNKSKEHRRLANNAIHVMHYLKTSGETDTICSTICNMYDLRGISM